MPQDGGNDMDDDASPVVLYDAVFFLVVTFCLAVSLCCRLGNSRFDVAPPRRVSSKFI